MRRCRLRRQIACFKSLAARNAIFLLALILMLSPVAGLRPIRAGRLRTCKMPRPFKRMRLPFLRCLVMSSTICISRALTSAFLTAWASESAVARCRRVTVSTLAFALAGATLGMLNSMRFMCCPIPLSGVTDDLENLVIPERYVYSRSLDIKSLTPLQQTRGAWSICHGLCKFSARASPDTGCCTAKLAFRSGSGDCDENGVDQEGGQHAAQGHDHVMVP